MTACYAENVTKDNILAALKTGNCMMSDGPIVIMSANNKSMGDVINVANNSNLSFTITYNSTQEFGTLQNLMVLRNGIPVQTYSMNNYSGNVTWTTNDSSDAYYRVDANTSKQYSAYTNPIYTSVTRPIFDASFDKMNATTLDDMNALLTITNNNWQILNSTTIVVTQNDTARTFSISLTHDANQSFTLSLGRMNAGNLTVSGNATDVFGNVYVLQNKTINVRRMVLTSMNYNESLRVLDFIQAYNKTPVRLFFDGRNISDVQPNYCDSDGACCNIAQLKTNLGLDSSWQYTYCEKQWNDNSPMMWASFTNTTSNKALIFYQIGNTIVFDTANYTQETATFDDGSSLWTMYYLRRWIPDSRRFSFYRLWGSLNPTGSQNSMIFSLGTYIFHGSDVRNNRTNVYFSAMSVSQTIYGVETNLIAKLRFDGHEPSPFNYFSARDHFGENNDAIYKVKSLNRNATANFSVGINGSYGTNICCPTNREYETFSQYSENLSEPQRLPSYLIVRINGTVNATVRSGSNSIALNGTASGSMPNMTLVDFLSSLRTFVLGDITRNYTVAISAPSNTSYTILFYFVDNEQLSSSFYSIQGSGTTTVDTFSLQNSFAYTTYQTSSSSKEYVRAYTNMTDDIQSSNATYATDGSHTSTFDNSNGNAPAYEAIQYGPAIDFYLPANNSAFSSTDTVLFFFNATDANNDTLSYGIYLNGSRISSNNSINYSLSSFPTGNYSVRFSVSDNTSRSDEENITLSVTAVASVSAPPQNNPPSQNGNSGAGGSGGTSSSESEKKNQGTSGAQQSNSFSLQIQLNETNTTGDPTLASFETKRNRNSLTGASFALSANFDILAFLKGILAFLLRILKMIIFWK